jgi:FtsH-binding integral membrane protein
MENQLRWGFVKKVGREWVAGRAPARRQSANLLVAGAAQKELPKCVCSWSEPVPPRLLPASCNQYGLQVYGIIAMQLVLTAAVAAVVVLNSGVQHFMLRNIGVQIALLLFSILALIPLYIWRNSHPHNLVLLGIWTSLFSGAGGCGGGARLAWDKWDGGQPRQALLRCFGPTAATPTPLCFWCSHGGHGLQLLPASNRARGEGELPPQWLCWLQHLLALCANKMALWRSVRLTPLKLLPPLAPLHRIVQALVITAAVVLGLTAYAFHATRRGVDFSFMGPMLFGCLTAMIVWSIIQLFFPPGPIGSTIFALLGAFLFSAYLVFDTQLIIQRFDLDDYIWAAVTGGCCWVRACVPYGGWNHSQVVGLWHAVFMSCGCWLPCLPSPLPSPLPCPALPCPALPCPAVYLDIINLFLYILRLLGEQQRNN